LFHFMFSFNSSQISIFNFPYVSVITQSINQSKSIYAM